MYWNASPAGSCGDTWGSLCVIHGWSSYDHSSWYVSSLATGKQCGECDVASLHVTLHSKCKLSTTHSNMMENTSSNWTKSFFLFFFLSFEGWDSQFVLINENTEVVVCVSVCVLVGVYIATKPHLALPKLMSLECSGEDLGNVPARTCSCSWVPYIFQSK